MARVKEFRKAYEFMRWQPTTLRRSELPDFRASLGSHAVFEDLIANTGCELWADKQAHTGSYSYDATTMRFQMKIGEIMKNCL